MCNTIFQLIVLLIVIQKVRHINIPHDYPCMSSTLTVRLSDGMKAEIETLVNEIGLWETQTDFVTEAINEHIKKYWRGERFDH